MNYHETSPFIHPLKKKNGPCLEGCDEAAGSCVHVDANLVLAVVLMTYWLVVLTILKNISQWMSMGRIIPYSMENKECLKPPARYC